METFLNHLIQNWTPVYLPGIFNPSSFLIFLHSIYHLFIYYIFYLFVFYMPPLKCRLLEGFQEEIYIFIYFTY